MSNSLGHLFLLGVSLIPQDKSELTGKPVPPQLYLSWVLMDYFPKLTFIVFFPFLLHGLTFLKKIYLKKNNISDHLSKVTLLQNQTWVHLPSLSKTNMLTSDSGERKHGFCCRAPSKENRHSCSKDVKDSVREGASEYVI